MVKNTILQNAIDGKIQNAKMFELIALCSLHIEELSSEDCSSLSDQYGFVFYVSSDKNGKRYVCVRKNGKSEEESRICLFNLFKSNNLSYDDSKITFFGFKKEVSA